ncbi:MAG: L,D-transpeptidase [Candidatus Cryosericum sp.]
MLSLNAALLIVALVMFVPLVALGSTATEVLVDKSFHITMLLAGETSLAFPDAIGTTGDNATPSGSYRVTNKQANPRWHWEGKVYAPYLSDKLNGLGIRWIGISLPSYGLHGTNDPFSIGKDISHGCVRHENPDITRAFPMIPIGTQVRIIETPVSQQTEGMVTDFLEMYGLLTVMQASR